MMIIVGDKTAFNEEFVLSVHWCTFEDEDRLIIDFMRGPSLELKGTVAKKYWEYLDTKERSGEHFSAQKGDVSWR